MLWLFLSVVAPGARADDAADARAVFDAVVALEASADPQLVALYADDAQIVITRDGAVATFPGAAYKQMIPAGLAIAKLTGERSVYSDVRVEAQPDGFLFSATRASPSRCTTDDGWSIQVARRDGVWKVTEEHARAASVSACPVPKAIQKATKRYAARVPAGTSIDAETILDSMVSDGWLIHMRARLFQMAASELDLVAAGGTLVSLSTRQLCADTPSRALLDEGVVFRAEWVDRDGAGVALYDVSRASCLLAERLAPAR